MVPTGGKADRDGVVGQWVRGVPRDVRRMCGVKPDAAEVDVLEGRLLSENRTFFERLLEGVATS